VGRAAEGVPQRRSFHQLENIAFDFRISVSNDGEGRAEQKFASAARIGVELI
jgi:hypothetical protein